MRIDFISNFELADSSGGWNGINFKLYESLAKELDVKYFGGINPPAFFNEKLQSKVLRSIGRSGNFYFFSETRLNNIKRILQACEFSGDMLFFFGATPWIKFIPAKPYAVYLDICFSRYLDIFLKGQRFRQKDINRIARLEHQFLINAKHVFWGSNWAMQEYGKIFNTTLHNSHVISTGGHIDIPTTVINKQEKNLLFISLNFQKKGGIIAYRTFLALKKEIEDITLTIIGEQPPEEVINTPGVIYLGILQKDKEEHLRIFRREFERSFFLIHPTEMDTMGAVIAEAGYYGLPTIASRNFGIPDLIQDGKTGILVDIPFDEHSFTGPLKALLSDHNQYHQMRSNVRAFMVHERSWPAIAKRIVKIVAN